MNRNTTSEYDARKKQFQRDKYGKENVYFASSDFVRWASPETAGKWVVLLVASGGSAAPAIIAEVKTQMRKELTHILTWLETHGNSRKGGCRLASQWRPDHPTETQADLAKRRI